MPDALGEVKEERMKWLRFSIGQVMVVVLYCSFGFAAFRNAGPTTYGTALTNAFFLLTVGLLAVATLMAFFREGRSRACWLGFALLGGMHLCYGWPNAGGPGMEAPWRPRFPHTRVISELLMRLGIIFSGSNQEGAQRWNIFQSALTIATGLLGAGIGYALATRLERRSLKPAGEGQGGWRPWVAGLVGLALYTGVGVAAYRQADDPVNYGRFLDNAYFLATVGSLTIAALVASLRQGRSRARWLAFAVFGWLHIELGWPNSTMNPFGVPWRSEFPHVVLLAGQLQDVITPNAATSNMFRWHVVQSSMTMATALLGAAFVNFLPIVPARPPHEA